MMPNRYADLAVRMPLPRFSAGVVLVMLALVASACAESDDPGPEAASTTTEPELVSDTSPVIDETPVPPTGLRVVSTADGAIEIAWEPSRSESVTGYEIFRAASGGQTEQISVAEPGYVDDGLEDGDIYSYAVAAVSGGGTSVRSEIVTARVGIDENPPSVPGRPRVTASATAAVALEWRASTDISGVSQYIVERTVGGVVTEIRVAEPSLTDDIAPGVIVRYAVSAVDGNGNRSEFSRGVTLLSGSSTDRLVIVVSGTAEPASNAQTNRLQNALFDAGYVVTWFDDEVFDSNLTDVGDLVLLLGDVEAEGFDWNVFSTDAHVIGLKSMFMEASGLTENPPKLDRLSQLDYFPPDGATREVILTRTGRPKPVVYIPLDEQPPDLQVWGRPVWSSSIAVAGLVETGGTLANDKSAKGCRAFFPGNSDSLAEQTDDAWNLLIEFVGAVDERCG